VTSAVGYLYLSQDQQATRDMWRLVRAMSANKVQLFTSAEDVLGAVKAGRAAIGYNIVGSFALGEVERDATLGMVLPTDYTLLMSRIAIIPAAAPHPSAAKLFLDFLLSQRGQTHLAKVDMPSVRSDVVNPPAFRPAGIRLRAIRVGPGLLVSQDGLTRRYFLKRWETALARPVPVGMPFPPPAE
jgi:iron(III) transport system substrate-binding protein